MATPANTQQQGGRDALGRWEPGTSGNPAGRPKGISLAAILADVLTEEEARRVVRAVIREAKKGDVIAFKALIERTDGKVPQPVSGDKDNPLTIGVVRIGEGEIPHGGGPTVAE